MNEMDSLKRHYLLIFPMSILFLALGLAFGLKALWVSFFLLSFLWVWGLLTPGLKEKIRSPKYKFSFFRFMFWLERVVGGQLFFETSFSLKFVSRVAGPLIFGFLLSFLTGFQVLLACLIGVVVGEVWLYVNRRFYEEAFQKSESNLSENSL